VSDHEVVYLKSLDKLIFVKHLLWLQFNIEHAIIKPALLSITLAISVDETGLVISSKDFNR
jgi:hypothetical protein